MIEHPSISSEVAAAQTHARIESARRSRIAGECRPHGRHALAERLHRVAERLDV